jgi:hypothetical protein
MANATYIPYFYLNFFYFSEVDLTFKITVEFKMNHYFFFLDELNAL